MSSLLPQLALVAFLVLVNAAFAGTELALVSLRESQLRQLEDRSATGALLARLARNPNQFFATIQIGITLAGLLASAAAAVSLAEPLEEPLSFLGGAAAPTSVVAVTLVLAYITLVFGELAPKRIAMQKAERWGMVMARPLALLSALTRPVVWLLSASTDIVVRLLGADPNQQRQEVTDEELRDMVSAQETFTSEQRVILKGAFAVAERSLYEVLTPRGDVFVLDADLSIAEAIDALVHSGHSRAPVAPDRNLDDAIGVAHLRTLLSQSDHRAPVVTGEAPVFPETARVLSTLGELQRLRSQMAFVINEHGGVEGIVTIEDFVEEIVGEIYDETDRDLAAVRHEDDGTMILSGRFPVHDLTDIGVTLPEGDYATVAGFVMAELGRIPTGGEQIISDRWQLQVRSVKRHSVEEIAITEVLAANADMVPNDTVPNDTVPNDTDLDDTVPNDTVPNDTDLDDTDLDGKNAS